MWVQLIDTSLRLYRSTLFIDIELLDYANLELVVTLVCLDSLSCGHQVILLLLSRPALLVLLRLVPLLSPFLLQTRATYIRLLYSSLRCLLRLCLFGI